MIIPYIYLKYFFYFVVFVCLPVVTLILLKFFQRLTLGRCKSLVCLLGKTAIVTGGATGIGFETALYLASRGCRVIIADKYSALRAAKKIARITNNPNVLSKYLDLASLKSVRDFAKDINETEGRLDILINNARASSVSNVYTEDGLHETMQINHFGPFLLTHLLSDILKKSAPSRIIFVSSAAAFFSNLSIENLNYPKDHPMSVFRTGLIYGNSKLCNVIAANGFAKRLGDFGVTCNSLNPGWVNTRVDKNPEDSVGLEGIDQIIMSPISYVYAKTPREGAQTTLHLALSDSLKNVTGKHFWDCVTFPIPPGARNEKFCQDIWIESEIFVKLQDHEKLPLETKVFEDVTGQIVGTPYQDCIYENGEDVKDMLDQIRVNKKLDGSQRNLTEQNNADEDESDNFEENEEQKKIIEESHEENNGGILRFRKINEKTDFLKMNGNTKQNEARERS